MVGNLYKIKNKRKNKKIKIDVLIGICTKKYNTNEYENNEDYVKCCSYQLQQWWNSAILKKTII